jgi:hypothetical protein
MDRSPEDLGLAPELSRLSRRVHTLILHGSRDGHPDRSEAAVEVCAAMFKAGYGVDEVWMVMTYPANGISKEFFLQNGEQAEAYLERIVSEAYELVDRRERDDE